MRDPVNLPEVSTAELNARWNELYRQWPYLRHRLAALEALFTPGTREAPCLTVLWEGHTLHEARALLASLNDYLDGCFAPAKQQAFRRGDRRLAEDPDAPS